jgi:hypothetical protein
MAGKQFTFYYSDILKMTDVSMDALFQHVSRGELDPNDIKSVVMWVAKYGSSSVRMNLIRSLIRDDLHVNSIGKGRKKRAAKKAGKKK